MLNRIIRFSLNNRLAILIAAVVIMVVGLFTAKTAEVDVFPDLNAPTVVVMTESNGMAPEEVERIVTFPIETAVNGATHVRRVRSSSTTGFSIVQVEFDWGTDIYRARQIVTEKLAAISESLPKSVGKPTLGPQSSILGEMLIVGLTIAEGQDNHSEPLDMLQLREIADWTIRPRLLSISGVANVAVMGGDEKEYQVLLHPEKLRHHSVSIQEILDAVEDMNQNVSGGTLYEYGNEYLIRGVLSSNDVEELGQTVVKSVNGVPVLLSQLADVEVGAKTPRTGVASNNARPAVLLTVTKQPNVSTEKLTAELDAAFDDIQHTIPSSISIDREIFRQQRFIDASISNIKEALIEGAVFVILVLFIFLMNWRTTIISLVTIPLSLLVSIIVLHLMGMTLNTMSIGGMAIAIGSLVDDAIVDVENVYKRIRQHPHARLLDVVFNASREVRMPILNSTLIIVVCFLPLFFLSGMEGRMLVPLGIAFILSLFASTIVALTLTPVLCSFLLKSAATENEGTERRDPRLVCWLKSWYEKALHATLSHRRLVLGTAIALFIVAVGLFLSFGRTFLPPFNEGSLTISISSLPGISLDESDKIGQQAEQLLMQIPEIRTVARKTGRAELDEHAFGVNTSEIEAPFELGSRKRDEFMDEVRQKLRMLPGVSIEIGQPISHRIDAMLSGTQANIAIKVFGSDLNKLYSLGNEIKAEIRSISGVTDLNVEQQVERPQLRITPRRSMMAKYGVTPSQFADYVHVLLEGESVSTVYEGNNAFDLTVKVASEDRDAIESIRSLMVDADGKKIPFEYIANIESTSGPNTINRENVQRKVVVACNVSGRDLRSTVDDIQQRISSDINLPEGYHIEYGGQFESEASASRILMLISCISILIIYLLLYAQFQSAHQATVVLLNLPLALIGGVFAIALTGGVVSIPSIIGFISLFGIATRNGILLVDKYNEQSPATPQALQQHIIDASLDRLTPILMTALTSALALIPLALGGDLPGNEIQSPMAKVLLGGLISSTLLNMFITPLVYRPSHKVPPHTPLAPDAPITPTTPASHHRPLMALAILLLTLTFPVQAQHSVAEILQLVDQNNTSLKAAADRTEMARQEALMGTTLDDPEVGFDYLWGKPGVIGKRKDVSITQSLDLATLFGYRRRLAHSQQELLELDLQQLRLEKRVEAMNLLVELTYCNQALAIYDERLEQDLQLALAYQKRLTTGDASKLEVNRVQLTLAETESEAERIRIQRDLLLIDLQTLCGGATIDYQGTDYQALCLTPTQTLTALQEAQNAQQLAIAEAELRTTRAQSLPTLTTGYMAELTEEEKWRGITLGVSIPLWGNRQNLRRAHLQQQTARSEAADAAYQLEQTVASQRLRTERYHAIADRLHQQIEKASTHALLRKALDEGEISLIDYNIECSDLYELRIKALEAERDYQQSLQQLAAME